LSAGWRRPSRAGAGADAAAAGAPAALLTNARSSILTGMELANLFRVDGDAVRLCGSRCPACGAAAFPARTVCGDCGHRSLEAAELSGRGRVHAATSVATPPAGFERPYLAAVVDLDEGPRVFGLLTADPGPAGRVRAVPAAVRDGRDGFAFAPLEEPR
jgi:uncharacterized OB-fold protein